MLEKATITAFLATANPKSAKKFYETILGHRLLTDDEFALAFDCNGIQLRIQKVEKLLPDSFTALGWQVEDIRKAVVGLSKRGVSFERYTFLQQDELGVWLAPSGTKVAWFKDPDGNLLSLAENQSA
jgi:catechol 2,3-dioxygenase-like lactoylglutathione lyase family enzyme